MNAADSPCRLFVYLAREAPLAVVLRRGPSAWARLSLWHTGTDTFEHGQWIKARVFERRSDLSPDGSLFVAFIRKTEGRTLPNRDTWVAVSRPPRFTALALWFVGGTYHTGGFFPDRHTLWSGFTTEPPDEGALPGWLTQSGPLPLCVDGTNNWTERTVWFNRLLRDGWERVEGTTPETWTHRDPAGDLTLLMTLLSDADFGTYGGPHVVEYAVRAKSAGAMFSVARQPGRTGTSEGASSWPSMAGFSTASRPALCKRSPISTLTSPSRLLSPPTPVPHPREAPCQLDK